MTIDKREWYEYLMEKAEKALDNGFYFEALFIEYMILDDRIKSLCKLAGISLTVIRNNRTYNKDLGTLLNSLKNYVNNQSSGKWSLLKIGMSCLTNAEIQQLYNNNYNDIDYKQYITGTKKLINYKEDQTNGNIVSFFLNHDTDMFEIIKSWKNERNHWMHQAGDDGLSDEEYHKKIIPLAIDGMTIYRELCDITMKIKRSVR